eukprot:CFRG8679
MPHNVDKQREADLYAANNEIYQPAPPYPGITPVDATAAAASCSINAAVVPPSSSHKTPAYIPPPQEVPLTTQYPSAQIVHPDIHQTTSYQPVYSQGSNNNNVAYPPQPQSQYAQGGPLPAYPTYVSTQPHAPHTGMAYKPSFKPQRLFCSSCQKEVITKISHHPGLCSWLGAGICCVFGCWLGCCCIPLIASGCQDVTHRCPYCKTVLGTRARTS